MLYVNALNLQETVAPTQEPVTTAQVKTHWHIDTDDHDNYLDTLIPAARAHVESYTGRVLVERTLRADLRNWDSEVILPKPPLISVTSVKYFDTSNVQQTWGLANYQVDRPGGRILIAATGSIPAYFYRFDSWQVTFTAGYESTTSPQDFRKPVPDALKSAIKLIVGTLFVHRATVITGQIIAENPAWEMLMNPYRTRI